MVPTRAAQMSPPAAPMSATAAADAALPSDDGDVVKLSSGRKKPGGKRSADQGQLF
jgi:hypothetical protein